MLNREMALYLGVPQGYLPKMVFPVNVSVPEIRSAVMKDGPVITDLGNVVVDVG